MYIRSRRLTTTARVLAAVLSLSIVFALSGCTAVTNLLKPKDAYTLYTAATQNLDKADGYSMRMTMDGTLSSGSESQPYSTLIEAKVNKPYTAAMEMSMDMEMSVAGQDIDTTSYYKNGVIYTDALGMKIKTKTDMDQLKGQLGTATFSKDAIIEQQRSQTDDGIELDFTVKGSALKSYVLDKSRTEDLQLPSGVQYDIDDVTIHAVIGKSGQLSSVKMDMPLTMTYAGQRIKAEMDVGIDDIRYGQQDITAPDDLEDYQDSSNTGASPLQL